MRGINDTLQADLVEMIPYATQNHGKKYILTVINIFSKKAYAHALKNKSAQEVAKGLESILNSLNHPIKYIHTDKGKEFYNGTVRTMLDNRNVQLYSTFSTVKAAICERFNRTLKSNMWKQFSLRGSHKWVDILPGLIADYNHTKHRTIKMRPNDVGAHNEAQLLASVYKYTINTTPEETKFKVGDSVRLSKYKHAFEKGYTPNWTTEIFKIVKVQSTTNPITYRLEDFYGHELKGAMYAEELQLARYPDVYLAEKIIRRRNGRMLVKWLGFGDEFNEWVDEEDVTE